ncbi:unnamed protein product [Arctia plantaginis]|uniref:Uncharacterized protein n=1 Tax=Arctia plantaginis TaxID=874455 RepID=A0A8S1A2V7_ARCPL|nr:unnamed protein product [Arctia plantaginis]CAB3240119.1 unnamed protein product [Arctia plantaginis]
MRKNKCYLKTKLKPGTNQTYKGSPPDKAWIDAASIVKITWYGLRTGENLYLLADLCGGLHREPAKSGLRSAILAAFKILAALFPRSIHPVGRNRLVF